MDILFANKIYNLQLYKNREEMCVFNLEFNGRLNGVKFKKFVKVNSANRKNECARCVAYVPEQIW